MRYFFLILLISTIQLSAQIPVEIFAGHQRTTVDIMFFRFFKKTSSGNSPWLFFNRNRVSADYRIKGTQFLPQFGFTEAVSYNHKVLKGFAPVIVGQIFSTGIYSKAGIQYAKVKSNFTLFGWLVSETYINPDLDFFMLLRYTPKISKKINLFTQIETLNSFPAYYGGNFSFTQRLRLGLKIKDWQFGAGTDAIQAGKHHFSYFFNFGGFLRHEF